MSASVLTETAKFIQHKLPGLDPGEYAIEVSHKFSGPKVGEGDSGLDTTTPLLYKFAVKGPRFKLDPNSIHSVFPPKNVRGEFLNVLPHITLNKEKLPWIRVPVAPDNNVFIAPFAVGQDSYDLDVPSWMAVLLLTEDDFIGSDLKMTVTSNTVQNLFPGANPTFISPMSKIPQADLMPWETLDESCQTIDIPIGVFNGIAPSLADLFMIANVREVNMKNKPIKPDVDICEVGSYSVVIGNRMPMKDKRHLAVLVSLEHMQDYLPDWDGKPATQGTGITFARLPVFHSWNFVSSGDTFKFDHLLESLNGRIVEPASQTPEALPNAYLRKYPIAGAPLPSGAAKQALKMGYVPLKHLTRNGQTTASWYRSPFMPFAFQGDARAIAFRNSAGAPQIYDADALLRLNPNTGLFDTSYAAAWQLGRLLALQDQSFSLALYQWKKQMTIQLISIIEDSVLKNTFSEILAIDSLAESSRAKAVDTGTRQALLEQTMSLLSNKFNKKPK
tara:strand:+ start:1317 stop:2822 length:1506 start_codon:yes stop_codon:yes gene_type:complete